MLNVFQCQLDGNFTYLFVILSSCVMPVACNLPTTTRLRLFPLLSAGHSHGHRRADRRDRGTRRWLCKKQVATLEQGQSLHHAAGTHHARRRPNESALIGSIRHVLDLKDRISKSALPSLDRSHGSVTNFTRFILPLVPFKVPPRNLPHSLGCKRMAGTMY